RRPPRPTPFPYTTLFRSSGYDIVAIPALFAWSDELREAIENFDGYLLIGPRSGSKTKNFSIPSRLGPDLSPNLLDARVTRVDSVDRKSTRLNSSHVKISY